MDNNTYTISAGTKGAMLFTAMLFDAIQLASFGLLGLMFTTMATMLFTAWFFEKGALTISTNRAVGILRTITPILEIILPFVPGITLMVWVQIELSRLVDTKIPTTLRNLVRMRRGTQSVTKVRTTRSATTTTSGPQTIVRGRRAPRNSPESRVDASAAAMRAANLRAQQANITKASHVGTAGSTS